MSIEKLKKLIGDSDNIVFFGGAGVSTESNIPDFRSENGLYKSIKNIKYAPETMLSHSFFMSHTEEFYDFYRNKMIYKEAVPNAAHMTLARLESIGKVRAVITQNIDGLHQMAGSKKVLELHGSVNRNYCMDCGKSFGLDYVVNSKTIVPLCDSCGGILKPDVVLYEEPLDMDVVNMAVNYISEADVMIVGGTSLVVYPAANLVNYYRGNKLILINKSSTQYDRRANLVISDSIGKVLKEIL
jgi:NAD-dependent deacetylase